MSYVHACISLNMLYADLLINFRTRHFSRFYDIKKAFDGTATDINDPIFIF